MKPIAPKAKTAMTARTALDSQARKSSKTAKRDAVPTHNNSIDTTITGRDGATKRRAGGERRWQSAHRPGPHDGASFSHQSQRKTPQRTQVVDEGRPWRGQTLTPPPAPPRPRHAARDRAGC